MCFNSHGLAAMAFTSTKGDGRKKVRFCRTISGSMCDTGTGRASPLDRVVPQQAVTNTHIPREHPLRLEAPGSRRRSRARRHSSDDKYEVRMADNDVRNFPLEHHPSHRRQLMASIEVVIV